MKRKTKGNGVQPLLPFENGNPGFVTPQAQTIPAPPEPYVVYVEGECHCNCPGCKGTSGTYHCYKKGRGCDFS